MGGNLLNLAVFPNDQGQSALAMLFDHARHGALQCFLSSLGPMEFGIDSVHRSMLALIISKSPGFVT